MPDWLFEESLRRRRRPRRDDRPAPAAGRAVQRPCRCAHWVEERLLPLRRMPRGRSSEATCSTPGPQMDDRQRFVWNKLITGGVPRRRLAAAGHPGTGRGRRARRGGRRPPADGRLGADAGVLRAAARRRTPATPTSAGRIRSSWPIRSKASPDELGAGGRLAGRVEVGRHPLAAHPPRPGRRSSGRAARSWSPSAIPSCAAVGDRAARRHRDRRRDPALERRRRAAVRRSCSGGSAARRSARSCWPRCRSC